MGELAMIVFSPVIIAFAGRRGHRLWTTTKTVVRAKTNKSVYGRKHKTNGAKAETAPPMLPRTISCQKKKKIGFLVRVCPNKPFFFVLRRIWFRLLGMCFFVVFRFAEMIAFFSRKLGGTQKTWGKKIRQ